MDSVSLPYADLNSARLRYADKGSGPTLLLMFQQQIGKQLETLGIEAIQWFIQKPPRPW